MNDIESEKGKKTTSLTIRSYITFIDIPVSYSLLSHSIYNLSIESFEIWDPFRGLRRLLLCVSNGNLKLNLFPSRKNFLLHSISKFCRQIQAREPKFVCNGISEGFLKKSLKCLFFSFFSECFRTFNSANVILYVFVLYQLLNIQFNFIFSSCFACSLVCSKRRTYYRNYSTFSF